jgi:radical SAM protein with 4Fe4S-binding SPASM domain
MEINLLKYFTFKRFINVIKVLSSFLISRLIRKPVIWGMPISYSIEPTNHCNLMCPECPSGLGILTRQLGLLKSENFKNWIDQIQDTGFYLQLFFQGEPYLNKNLTEFIKYAQDNNIYVSISTNGLLINEKNVDKILENAPDKMIFSVDGLDEQSYQNYRVGGTFEQADKSLRLLVKRKKELKRKLPYIEFQFIVMKQNEHLLDEVRNYCKEVGVDKLVFKTMQISSFENAIKFLPTNPKYRRYIVENGTYRMKGEIKNYCFALWRTAVITWDGKMVSCCFDKDANYALGTLNGNSIEDVWTSEKYQNFRQAVLNNRKQIPICTNCTEGLRINILEMEQ